MALELHWAKNSRMFKTNFPTLFVLQKPDKMWKKPFSLSSSVFPPFITGTVTNLVSILICQKKKHGRYFWTLVIVLCLRFSSLLVGDFCPCLRART